MFGVLDSSLQYLRGDSHGTQTRLHSGAHKSSRIGFRGVEDLGGGWGAGFWIEAGFNSDTGTGSSTNTQNQPGASAGSGGLTFNRRSTVSLLSPFGELRAGRDYSPAFLTHAAYDVFGINGVASGGRLTLGLASELLRPRLVTEARVSNSLNIGASILVGSSQIRGSLVSARAKSPRHSNLARGRMASIGYVHHLSKRSVLYGTYSHIRNGRNALLHGYNNGLATLRRGGSTSGTESGVNHTF